MKALLSCRYSVACEWHTTPACSSKRCPRPTAAASLHTQTDLVRAALTGRASPEMAADALPPLPSTSRSTRCAEARSELDKWTDTRPDGAIAVRFAMTAGELVAVADCASVAAEPFTSYATPTLT